MRSRVFILAGLAHLLLGGGVALAQSNALEYMSPFAGIAISSKEMKPGTKVIGGEPVGAPKLSQTLDAEGLATLPNATGNVVAACANIAGQWDATETITVTCVAQGFPPETITQTGSGSLTMQQSGCNISYTIPQINFLRSGTINGNSIHMTGKFVEAPQCVITQNLATLDGTVENDRRISLSGTGVAVGTCQGVPVRCDGTSTALFTRDLPEAPEPPEIEIGGDAQGPDPCDESELVREGICDPEAYIGPVKSPIGTVGPLIRVLPLRVIPPVPNPIFILTGSIVAAGSPASISQVVPLPDKILLLSFDFKFQSNFSTLSIFLGDTVIGKLFVDNFLMDSFLRKTFLIDGSQFDNTELLTFELDSNNPGASVLLTNIGFPNLINGNFATGDFTGWTAVASGQGGAGVFLVTPPVILPILQLLLLEED